MLKGNIILSRYDFINKNNSLQVDPTDDSFQDDTVVDVPHQADCNSRCYIGNLPPEDQPFIPLENDEESLRLYNEYCSVSFVYLSAFFIDYSI